MARLICPKKHVIPAAEPDDKCPICGGKLRAFTPREELEYREANPRVRLGRGMPVHAETIYEGHRLDGGKIPRRHDT